MSEDEFEKKLRSLTGALRRPDPTPVWKADILGRARREADAMPGSRMLPPRWLMLTWAAAWAAILTMNFTTPEETTFRTSRGLASVKPTRMPAASSHGDFQTLLAYHQRMRLNLDLPE